MKTASHGTPNNDTNIALHQKITDRIVEEIRSGHFRLGDKLPSQADLVKTYSVSVGTVRQSLANLERRGIIRRETGRGSFVSLQGNNSPRGLQLRSIGLITEITGNTDDAPAEQEVLNCFSLACKRLNIRLMSDQTAFDAHLGGTSLIRTFEGLPLDGVCAFLHHEEDVEKRVAILGREFKAAVLLRPGPLHHSVTIDSIDVNLEAGMRQLMNYLIALGHKRIAYIGPHVEDSLAGKEWMTGGRWKAYREVLVEAGLAIERDLLIDVPSGNSIDSKYIEATINLVRSDRPATAIFAANDWMAREVMHWFWREGIHIPRDVCLAGLDDINFSRQLVPSLTTVAFPFAKAAKVAIELMHSRLIDSGRPAQKVTLNTELMVRDSTCSVDRMADYRRTLKADSGGL